MSQIYRVPELGRAAGRAGAKVEGYRRYVVVVVWLLPFGNGRVVSTIRWSPLREITVTLYKVRVGMPVRITLPLDAVTGAPSSGSFG